ncbi:MAG: hypothetical protein GFH27_549323n67 [Chloroflexi bacterium AL-W]|nr:hypothetical protein [Chloroflexi bacterium AL-N1]NOK70218.1 hypothetical protein [Chloroflexi bacterium AL-N10]NOK77755.1 hypothetical protein [Chloroflexi bacterium AL-N5]NOK84764.1 hypothetical protein [Chloroflexi bacterium AL-W]NOK92371.1 hypothetical protein [Chloroflexi bacterium AL-N15]
MANPRLEQMGQAITTEQPRPPRRLDKDFVSAVLLDKTEIFGFLFGLMVFLSGMGLFLFFDLSDRLTLLCAVLALIAGALLMSTPFIAVWQWWRALRYGRLGYAEVIEVVRHGQNRSSFTAMDHGTLLGTWQVDLGTETLEMPFKLERPWNGKVIEGVEVIVLVHPSQPKVLFPLGVLTRKEQRARARGR